MCTFSTPEESGGGAELLLDVFRDQIMVAKSYNTTMNEPHRTIPMSEAVSCFLSLPLHAKLLQKTSSDIFFWLLFFLSLSSWHFFLSPPCCPTWHNSIAGLFSHSTKATLGRLSFSRGRHLSILCGCPRLQNTRCSNPSTGRCSDCRLLSAECFHSFKILVQMKSMRRNGDKKEQRRHIKRRNAWKSRTLYN